MSEKKDAKESRLGVFVCHCGENIAGKVDVEAVAEYAKTLPNVAHAEDYIFMCSKQGIELVQKAVKEHNLTGTVVASCSHEQHWKTFAEAIEEEGLNPHKHCQVNIREFCSWVTDGYDDATEKARRFVAAGVAKGAMKEEVATERIPVTKKVMVIGAGVAGLRAAMDVAELGIPVVIVEKAESIGGHMAQLNKTFPTDECPMCTVSPLLNGVMNHLNIEVLTLSEVTNREGTIGNFELEVTTKARYVKDNCTSCGECAAVCPVEIPNEWDKGFGIRKAIYKPFPQALPSIFTLNKKQCIDCGQCVMVCPVDAIDFDMKKKTKRTIKVGSIILAVGYDEYNPTEITQYHYEHPNIITQLEFERLLAPTTLNKGRILRPSDGTVPKSVVIVQCVGSRNEQVGNEYCTGVCCMYGLKNSGIIKEHLPDTEVFFCYVDIRTPGLYYDEYARGRQKKGIHFVRGRPSSLEPEADGGVRVLVEDTLNCRPMEIKADMVVLSAGMNAASGIGKLGSSLGILRTKEGFAKDFHIKMGPVRSSKDGIFLAGAIQGPKDITQSVAQAGGAASAAAQPLVKGYIEKKMDTAVIDDASCVNCLACITTCAAGAIQPNGGDIPEVIAAACQSCGVCVPSCPTGAIQIRNFRETQVGAEVKALLGTVPSGGGRK
ncbi:MAG: 4Fe-4S binding protein [Candidatus Thorarchaeota archaeon]